MFMEKDNKEKTKPATTQMVPVSSESLDLARMSRDINTHLADESVKRTLLATTFKGLEPVIMKQAIMEGMIRGFNFKNFLEKDVYAIPFGKSYSITQSIDYIRKIGMRAGIVGKSAPEYTYEENKKVESCLIVVWERNWKDTAVLFCVAPTRKLSGPKDCQKWNGKKQMRSSLASGHLESG